MLCNGIPCCLQRPLLAFASSVVFRPRSSSPDVVTPHKPSWSCLPVLPLLRHRDVRWNYLLSPAFAARFALSVVFRPRPSPPAVLSLHTNRRRRAFPSVFRESVPGRTRRSRVVSCDRTSSSAPNATVLDVVLPIALAFRRPTVPNNGSWTSEDRS